MQSLPKWLLEACMRENPGLCDLYVWPGDEAVDCYFLIMGRTRAERTVLHVALDRDAREEVGHHKLSVEEARQRCPTLPW